MLSLKDKEKVAALKENIKETAQKTRATRNESREKLAEARALRRKGSPLDQYDVTSFTREAIRLRENTKDICQRENLLAYGYLRGRKYKQLEAKTHTNDWDMGGVLNVAANIAGVNLDDLKTWWKEDVTRFDIEPQEEMNEVKVVNAS